MLLCNVLQYNWHAYNMLLTLGAKACSQAVQRLLQYASLPRHCSCRLLCLLPCHLAWLGLVVHPQLCCSSVENEV